ncbi:DUF4290 domain-containing protein [Brumimicrobium mesophilum]|uniref:DUF4290 domain-containing protein n=1 Tax=Brumimicrobium mesophilum TaxID=392717 RepID=UPI00131EC5B6|nr:DUF4290 domain-containing protein [Brumimicrobium mesophilum]
MEEYSMNALSYNTERAQLHIQEYGRNVQNMINFAKQIESREERNLAARAIIDVMGQLNPHLRDVEDYTHKLWTHMYIMSNFEIDVDSPYEIPEPETLSERPKIMKYPRNSSKYGHFGYYAERMIKETVTVEDQEEKDYLTELLANLLKKNYLTFHTQNVENSAITSHLRELSKGQLKLKDISLLKPTNTILKTVGVTPKKPMKKHKSKKRRK